MANHTNPRHHWSKKIRKEAHGSLPSYPFSFATLFSIVLLLLANESVAVDGKKRSR